MLWSALELLSIHSRVSSRASECVALRVREPTSELTCISQAWPSDFVIIGNYADLATSVNECLLVVRMHISSCMHGRIWWKSDKLLS